MGLNLKIPPNWGASNFQMIYYSALVSTYVFYRSATVPTIKLTDGKYAMTPTSTAYWHSWNASTQTWGSQNTSNTSSNFPFDKTTIAEVDEIIHWTSQELYYNSELVSAVKVSPLDVFASSEVWTITDGINNNYPYLSGVPIPSDTTLTEPYPTWIWRIDPFYNDGYPYLIGLRPPEYHVDPVKQRSYISVYDSKETDFEHNGLRVLSPLSCEITEELNGAYELTLTHPIDTDNNWLYLNEFNIIKTQGQLFRIYKRVKSMAGDSVTVYARHIWYDLLANFIEDVRPTLMNGQSAIDWILGNTHEEHNFTGTSDIDTISTAYYMDMSPVLAFLGADNAFITRWGGELYRDNFNFSINTRRGKDNAFNIRYGVDMLDIEETVDYSEFCTTLIAEDNFGNRIRLHSPPNPSPYRHVKKLIFNYDVNDRSVLQADALAYMDIHKKPLINYKVTFANLKNVDEYKDFINLQRCELGDTGIIYNERLDISNVQKIVKKTVDGITGDVISIELGTAKGTITRPKKFTNTMSPQDTTYVLMQQVYKQLQLQTAKLYPTWNSNYESWKYFHKASWNDFI